MSTRYAVTIAAMALREAMVLADISTISIPGMEAALNHSKMKPRQHYCEHGYPIEERLSCKRCFVGELHIEGAKAAIRIRNKKKAKEG